MYAIYIAMAACIVAIATQIFAIFAINKALREIDNRLSLLDRFFH